MKNSKLIFLFIIIQALCYYNKFYQYAIQETLMNVLLCLIYILFFVELFKIIKTKTEENTQTAPTKNIELLPIIVFSTYRILHLYATNIAEIPIIYTIISVLGILCINIGLYYLLLKLIKNIYTTSVLTSVLIILFGIAVKYSLLFSVANYLLLLFVVAVIILKTENKKLFEIICLISCFLLFFNTVELTYNLIRDKITFTKHKKEITLKSQIPDNMPNVYIILLDAYPNRSVLKREFGYDNKEFIESLETRGFFVFDEMWSNYTKTVASVPSVLNQQYIADMQFKTQSEAINKANLFYNAKTYGYKTVFINSFSSFQPNTNFYIDKVANIATTNAFSSYLLADIFFAGTLYYRFFSIFDNLRFIDNDIFWPILANITHNKEKQFVFGHILKPHNPYTKDEYGNDVYENDYQNNGTTEINKPACLKFIKYTNRKTIDAVDNILKSSGPNTYIIIFGDHGLRLNYAANRDREIMRNKSVRNAAFATFAAIYSPKKNYNYYKNATTLKEFFRLFSNDLFDTSLKSEPNKFYHVLFATSSDSDLKYIKKNIWEYKKSQFVLP